MDYDFGDFTEDKIKSFLTNKLEEIRLQNLNLERVLDQCQSTLRISNEHVSHMDDININCLTMPWKKIFGGKYTLGFTLELNSHILEDISVVLEWNSRSHFSYNVHIFPKQTIVGEHLGSKCTALEPVCSELCGDICVIVSFDIPEFVDIIEYRIQGNICCKVEDGRHVNLSVPETTICTGDFGNHQLHDWVVRTLDFDGLITIMSCSNEMEMVMVLPDQWNPSIQSTCEIHCSLTKILQQQIDCISFFIAYKVSQLFDNSLIAVHKSESNVHFLNIYTTSDKNLVLFVHYLHSCIPNLVLFPKIYYRNYVTNNSKFSKDILPVLKESISKEIEFVQNSVLGLHKPETSCFREKLCDLEKNTDLLYSQICNMNYQ